MKYSNGIGKNRIGLYVQCIAWNPMEKLVIIFKREMSAKFFELLLKLTDRAKKEKRKRAEHTHTHTHAQINDY